MMTIPRGFAKQYSRSPSDTAEKKGKGHDVKYTSRELRTSFLVQSKCVPSLVHLLKAEIIPLKLWITPL